MHMEILSVKWQPFYLSLNGLRNPLDSMFPQQRRLPGFLPIWLQLWMSWGVTLTHFKYFTNLYTTFRIVIVLKITTHIGTTEIYTYWMKSWFAIWFKCWIIMILLQLFVIFYSYLFHVEHVITFCRSKGRVLNSLHQLTGSEWNVKTIKALIWFGFMVQKIQGV